MNILKSPQRVLILFLSALVVISFIMILRLECKTAILQSRLDEHHKSLEKNKDVLDNLESFSRLVKKNAIKIDGNKVQLTAGQSIVKLSKELFHSMVGKDFDKTFNMHATLGTHINFQGSELYIGPILSPWGKVQGIQLNSPNGSALYITDNKVSIESQKLSIEADGDITITSKNGNVNINGKKVNLNE